MTKLSLRSLSAIAIFLLAAAALAHHNGGTYFDLSVTIEHNDVTVVSYNIVNPHGRLVYTFTDEAGNRVEWAGELPSANNVRRRGLGGELFKPGDRLESVAGSPARSGANFMRLDRVVLENGDIAQITGPHTGLTRAGSQ